jgi:hypothetical protein
MAAVRFIDDKAIIDLTYFEQKIFERTEFEVDLRSLIRVDLETIPEVVNLGDRKTTRWIFEGFKGTYLYRYKKRVVLGQPGEQSVRVLLFNPNFDEIWFPAENGAEIAVQFGIFLRKSK